MIGRVILLGIGIALFLLGVSLAYVAQKEVQENQEDILDHYEKLLSSNFPVGLGLMGIGGGFIVWGAVPRKKN